LIVEFLRRWFTEEDIKEILRSLPDHAIIARRYMEAALERMVEVKQEFDSLTLRGDTLLDEDNANKVLNRYDRAVVQNPDNASVWSNRGIVLRGLERLEEALDSCDRAIALKPDDVSAWINRGDTLECLELWEEALDSFDRAIALKPDDVSAWNGRGITGGN